MGHVIWEGHGYQSLVRRSGYDSSQHKNDDDDMEEEDEMGDEELYCQKSQKSIWQRHVNVLLQGLQK